MPVIAPGGDGGGGLAGKVTSVSGGTATVTLITDESSAVSAQVMPDGAAGIVKPTVGDPSDMLLDFIEKGRPVSQGHDGDHLRVALRPLRVALPARDPDRQGDGRRRRRASSSTSACTSSRSPT